MQEWEEEKYESGKYCKSLMLSLPTGKVGVLKREVTKPKAVRRVHGYTGSAARVSRTDAGWSASSVDALTRVRSTPAQPLPQRQGVRRRKESGPSLFWEVLYPSHAGNSISCFFFFYYSFLSSPDDIDFLKDFLLSQRAGKFFLVKCKRIADLLETPRSQCLGLGRVPLPTPARVPGVRLPTWCSSLCK